MSEQVDLPFPTTDGTKWASEFVRLHGGDEELMRVWFANAIEHGRGPSAAPSTPEPKGPVVGWRWADALRALHRHGLAYEEQSEGIRSALAAAAAFPSTPEPGIDVERLARAMTVHLAKWQEPDGLFKRGHARCNEACVPDLAAEYARLASRDRTSPAEEEQT